MHSHTDKDQVLYREQLEKDLISAKVALQERVVENVPTPNSNQLSTEVCTMGWVIRGGGGGRVGW